MYDNLSVCILILDYKWTLSVIYISTIGMDR